MFSSLTFKNVHINALLLFANGIDRNAPVPAGIFKCHVLQNQVVVIHLVHVDRVAVDTWLCKMINIFYTYPLKFLRNHSHKKNKLC